MFNECEPFELQPVDLVLDELNERREFRSCMHTSRNVLGESFLEPRRSRKQDVDLEEVDNTGQLERQFKDVFLHVPVQRKDDKQIDLKVSERAEGPTQTLTST